MKVIAIVAHTFDGFIARAHDEFIDWSSPEDKKMFTDETKKLKVVAMGITTFNTVGKPFKDRFTIALTSRADQFESIPDVMEYKNATPQELVAELEERGYESLCLAGGARTYTDFLKAKLVDEIWVTIEPVIFGQGISNFTEPIYGVNLTLTNTIHLNDNSLQLRFKVNYV